ncbi:hypothetical protein [Arthrobacter terrae]|uniref:hypothetical protein n=1 Tax=Arthrobacter terrae TaxID=2935737 RepID=UPI0018C259CE|nr:hypothetical protein [Arthrobacter terrae]
MGGPEVDAIDSPEAVPGWAAVSATLDASVRHAVVLPSAAEATSAKPPHMTIISTGTITLAT